MALTDIDEATTTDMQSATTDYIAGQEPWNKNLDGFTIDSKETESSTYQADWIKWHGYYREVPELRSTIDVWAKWIVGKEIKMNDTAREMTKRIKGNGLDTFRTILVNMKRTSKICGDSYAEIMRDKAGRIINLKMLDPGTIQVQANGKGIIKKYVQVASKSGHSTAKGQDEKPLAEWDPEEIFHLANDRIADEIHGIPEPEKLMRIIKWRQQSMNDLSVVFHRYVKPLLQINADTDDEQEIASLKTKYDNAVKNMENIIIPKGSVASTERISIPQYSTLDPLPWLIFLRSYFTESSGVPDLIRGKSDEVSLAAGKLNYLAFKEKIMQEQLEFQEQIESKLKIKVEFEIPKEIDIEIAKQNQDIEKRNEAKKTKKVVSGKAPEAMK